VPSKEFLEMYCNILDLQKFDWSSPLTDFTKTIGKDEEDSFINKIVFDTHKKDVKFNTKCPSGFLSVIIPAEPNEPSERLEILQDLIKDISTLANVVATEATFAEYTRDELSRILYSDLSVQLRNLWNIFKLQYMTVFFPQVSIALNLPLREGTQEHHKSCPKDVLDLLLDFMLEFSGYETLGDQSHIYEIGSTIVNVMLWSNGNGENSELMHEVLRQAFLYNMSEKALSIILKLLKVMAKDHKQYPKINKMIRRYIYYLKSQLSKISESENDIASYKQFGYFCRYITYVYHNVIEENTWDLTMNVFLEIHISILQSVNASYYTSRTGSGLSLFLSESILMIWIRKPLVSITMWEKLENLMRQHKDIYSIIKPWTVLLI
jgi:hypothetical protein